MGNITRVLPGHIRLGVNVDHVATLRQQRGTQYPDPVFAAALAEQAGASQITVHLREDRRHIQDRDVAVLRETVSTRLNLEMAVTQPMVTLALSLRPDIVTLVPEKREERTTEGGLDVHSVLPALRDAVPRFKDLGIEVSLFIDPDFAQIEAAVDVGAQIVELHTGDYCERRGDEQKQELERLRAASKTAFDAGLIVAAGHGLDFQNTVAVAGIPEIEELNIGHSIVCRALMVGFERAVVDMVTMLRRIRKAEQE